MPEMFCRPSTMRRSPAAALSLSLAPADWEMAALAALVAASLAVYSLGGTAVLILLGPLSLAAILGTANVQLARRSAAAIWTPLFAFRMAALVYFGLGGFLPRLFDEATMDYALVLYGYTPAEEAKVLLIWIIGTASVLGGARIFSEFMDHIAVTTALTRDSTSDTTLSMGLVFFAIGFGFYLVVFLPNILGIFTVLVPGSFLSLMDVVTSGGTFLIALWAFEQGGRGYFVVALLSFATALLGLIALTKAMVVLPELLICLAFLMRGVTLRRITVVSVIMLGSFAILQPLVAYGRDMHTQIYGDLNGGSVDERFEYIGAWLRGEDDRGRQTSGETVNPLSRLTYQNVATYVVSRYDTNQPSDSISTSLVAVVPRIIWPNKPLTTAMNEDLFYELTGQVGSAVSTTVPIDCYWNFGWPGVVVLSFLMGLPLMLASRRCYRIVAERDWLMMPFVLLCFRVSVAVDSQFVSAVFSPGVMAVVLYFALLVLRKLLPARMTGRVALSIRN